MIHLRRDYDRIQDPAGKIPLEEPVFLLRGQDPAAVAAVLAWADSASELGADGKLCSAVRRWANYMSHYALHAGHGVPTTPSDQLRTQLLDAAGIYDVEAWREHRRLSWTMPGPK